MTEFNRNYDLHHPSYNQARPYLWLYSTLVMTVANPTYGQTQPMLLPNPALGCPSFTLVMIEPNPSYDRI